MLAVLFSALQTIDAAPDVFFCAVTLDPLGAAIHTAAFTADQTLRQCELACVLALFRFGFALRDFGTAAATGQFQLYLLEYLPRNNSRMVVRHIILCQFTAVLFDLLGQEVCGKGFLQQHISGVFFIAQDVLDGGL